MLKQRPFIPRDKPKFFIVASIAALFGLLDGALLLAVSLAEVRWAETLFGAGFWLSWFVMAFCMIGFLAKQWSGKYHELRERPWKEQLW